ncbi:MAG: TIGR04086 family membrane protein [Syntrophomonadaceae bacterium]|nr:TIGR04086 family membrane protein [Syntrophomonadaceae bacterium]
MNKPGSVEIMAISKAIAISLVLCIFAGTIVYYSSIPDTSMALIGKLIVLLSIFWAGCYVSRHYGSKGLVRGISMGIAFFIVMLIATLAFDTSLISPGGLLYSLTTCIVAGGLGGILGLGLSDING